MNTMIIVMLNWYKTKYERNSVDVFIFFIVHSTNTKTILKNHILKYVLHLTY